MQLFVINKNIINTNTNYKKDVIVDGCDNILVNLAECCYPVKGDQIVGFITKGDVRCQPEGLCKRTQCVARGRHTPNIASAIVRNCQFGACL